MKIVLVFFEDAGKTEPETIVNNAVALKMLQSIIKL